jgi:hypothetical protein
VSTPSKPWQRADQLDAAGQLTWSARGEGKDEALLRVGYEGVLETDVARAIEAVLGRARTGIRAELEDRDGVERGGFEPDSMRSPGGLRWHGFRVVVSSNPMLRARWWPLRAWRRRARGWEQRPALREPFSGGLSSGSRSIGCVVAKALR